MKEKKPALKMHSMLPVPPLKKVLFPWWSCLFTHSSCAGQIALEGDEQIGVNIVKKAIEEPIK